MMTVNDLFVKASISTQCSQEHSEDTRFGFIRVTVDGTEGRSLFYNRVQE